MAFSTQRAVSDGTLQDLLLEIKYIDKEDVNVFIDDVPQVVEVDYEWISNILIRFTSPVPLDAEVLLQRATKLDNVLNIFTLGAVFDDPTMDENFRQMLYIAQEAREGSTLEEIFTNLNMHGYRVQNLGAGTEPGDAINYQQYMDDALGAGGARVAAEAARDAAVVARDGAQGFASAASASASTATTQAGIATTKAGEADTARAAAQGFATSASTSAATATTKAGEASTAQSAAEAAKLLAEAAAAASNANLLPVGGIHQYPTRVVIPAGFGAADGILVSRATFPDLWALIQAGTFPSVSDATWLADPLERGKYSTGDGSTTFRLPDYNGVQVGSIGSLFFRGSASAAGSAFRDTMQGHVHDVVDSYASGGGAAGGVYAANSVPIQVLSTGVPISDGPNGTPRTGPETRPMHFTGVWLIKLYGAAVNPGTVDIVQLAADYVALASRVLTLESRPVRTSTGATGAFQERVGIPSWVNRVTAVLSGVSTTGTQGILAQLGTAGGLVTSGYSGSHSSGAGGVSSNLYTTGQVVASQITGTILVQGRLVYERVSGSTWAGSGLMSYSGSASGFCMSGTVVTLPGALTTLRLMPGAPDTFDGGSIQWALEP